VTSDTFLPWLPAQDEINTPYPWAHTLLSDGTTVCCSWECKGLGILSVSNLHTSKLHPADYEILLSKVAYPTQAHSWERWTFKFVALIPPEEMRDKLLQEAEKQLFSPMQWLSYRLQESNVSLWKEVQQEVLAGRVKATRHPDLPLTLYTYTEETQYKRTWNDINRLCRALVLDEEGNQINYPFPKFFNFEELTDEEKLRFQTDKLVSLNTKDDGSLINVFNYRGAWQISSKGSWLSDQALLASELLVERFPTFFQLAQPAFTYLFELVGPRNVNVTRQYDKDDLILLAIRGAAGDLSPSALSDFAGRLNLSVVQPYLWSDQEDEYKLIKNNLNPNFEGVVLLNKYGERCKIKSDLYVRLHRVVTGNSERTCFEMWRDRSFVSLEGVPDEFFADIRTKIDEIEAKWQETLQSVVSDWEFLKEELASGKSRRDVAVNHKDKVYLLTDAVNNTYPEKVAFEHFCRKVYSYGVGPNEYRSRL
jgi:RNA ligase